MSTILNPIEFTLKHAKKQFKMSILGILVYAAAITLGLIWFDWKLVLVLFLFAWGNNIGLITSSIMPIQKWIGIKTIQDNIAEEVITREGEVTENTKKLSVR
jgi:uncharacterized membrane protein